MSKKNGEQTELLNQILNELRDMNGRLSRVDERSINNEESVSKLREERIIPVEDQADRNENRSRRNELILTAALTLAMALITGGISVAFGLI